MVEVISSATVYSRAKNIDEYSSMEEIEADIDAFTHENFILSQTVEVLERYLRKRSPTLLAGMDRFIDSFSTRSSFQAQMSVRMSFEIPSVASTKSSPSPGETGPRTSTTSSGARGLAIVPRSNAQSFNLSHRISSAAKADIVERELDENRMTMEKLQKRFKSAQFLLQTEEENLRIDILGLEKSKIALEECISQSTDKKSGKVFYDKFLRFLEMELQTGDGHLRNYKLKTKSLHTEYKRIQAQQQQRMELMERLHPIDIDKLLIENQEHLDILEERNKSFLDLKKIVGRKGQSLVAVKSRLNDTVVSLKNVKQDFFVKETKCNFMDEQELQNQNMLMIAENNNKNIKNLNTSYKSPDIHTYLKVISKLQDLKLEKLTWERRCKYQKQQISLLEHQVKQLSPIPRIRCYSSWRGRGTANSIFGSPTAHSIYGSPRTHTDGKRSTFSFLKVEHKSS